MPAADQGPPVCGCSVWNVRSDLGTSRHTSSYIQAPISTAWTAARTIPAQFMRHVLPQIGHPVCPSPVWTLDRTSQHQAGTGHPRSDRSALTASVCKSMLGLDSLGPNIPASSWTGQPDCMDPSMHPFQAQSTHPPISKLLYPLHGQLLGPFLPNSCDMFCLRLATRSVPAQSGPWTEHPSIRLGPDIHAQTGLP